MAATGRWAILRRALLARNATEQADVADTASTVSVRRFASFGLFHIDAIDCATVSNRFHVQQYSRKDHRILVCSLLETRQSHEALLGFNNTGNVCIWPAEEVLAKYSLDHLELFRGKRVLELGSGMTAFAGILVALYGGATSVALTDGNETSVEGIKANIAANQERFMTSASQVTFRQLRWSLDLPLDVHSHTVDVMLCADCLFFSESHDGLLRVIVELLAPGGLALFTAPTRGSTFHDFCKLVRQHPAGLSVDVSDSYDADVSRRRHDELQQDSSVFDDNLHMPLLLTIRRQE